MAVTHARKRCTDKSGCSSNKITGSYCKLYIIQGQKPSTETFTIIMKKNKITMKVTPETDIILCQLYFAKNKILMKVKKQADANLILQNLTVKRVRYNQSV